jgi:hypothetical protein
MIFSRATSGRDHCHEYAAVRRGKSYLLWRALGTRYRARGLWYKSGRGAV